MARFSLTGTIKSIGATQSFGSKGFTKRDIVIEESGMKFPNLVKFTLKKENCALADNYNEGDKVTVSASINGREWKNPKTSQVQYFVDLDAYKIVDSDGQASSGGSKKGKGVPPPAEPSAEDFAAIEDDNDIPF